jgi:hypothetical protein
MELAADLSPFPSVSVSGPGPETVETLRKVFQDDRWDRKYKPIVESFFYGSSS